MVDLKQFYSGDLPQIWVHVVLVSDLHSYSMPGLWISRQHKPAVLFYLQANALYDAGQCRLHSFIMLAIQDAGDGAQAVWIRDTHGVYRLKTGVQQHLCAF